MFEALTLGVFQVGLSWSTVFNKREAFRTAFHGFDIAKIAAMTDKDVDRLTQDASIIRNRAKIQATVDNARAMLSASPSLAELAKSYETTRRRSPRSAAALPTSTTHAETFARQLKAQGIPLRRPHQRVRVHAETSAWSTTTSTGASEPATGRPENHRCPGPRTLPAGGADALQYRSDGRSYRQLTSSR